MKSEKASRRDFIKQSVSTAAGMLAMSAMPSGSIIHESRSNTSGRREQMDQDTPRIRFSVIGINHDHIHGQIGATIRGGGEFVSFYAKEPELAVTFAKRYPQAKQAKDKREILEDGSTQLVL